MPLQTILAVLTIMAISMTSIVGLAYGATAALVVAACTLPAFGLAITMCTAIRLPVLPLETCAGLYSSNLRRQRKPTVTVVSEPM